MKELVYTTAFVDLLLAGGFFSARQISDLMNLEKSCVSESITTLLKKRLVVVYGFCLDETGKLIELTFTSAPFFLEGYNYRNN